MRSLRSLITIGIFTLGALIYVHQQVEIVKLSYAIELKEKKLDEILDKKDNIGYTIKQLENPARLEKVLLSKNIQVAFPDKGQIINYGGLTHKRMHNPSVRNTALERNVGIFKFLEFFGLAAEAQAIED